MNSASERSIPFWSKSAEVEDAPHLERDERVDVAVIGSGIAGLSAAYELLKAGKSVVVLDRGPLVGGMTARTTAHLASSWDDFYHELIGFRGEADARLCYQSQAAAIDRIEQIQAAEAINCDFARLDGYFFKARDSDQDILDRELDACRRIGFSGVEMVDAVPFPGLRTAAALRFPRQGRFHPLKYAAGLIRCIRRDGGRLYANSAVEKVEESSGEVVLTSAQGHKVTAGAALVATNGPINDKFAIHGKLGPYRTYVIAGRVERGSVPDALYWDTLDPYHYVRVQPLDDGADLLIVGGEDHKTGKAHDMEHRFRQLEDWTRLYFPQFPGAEERWSGQVLEPVDSLPFVGRSPGSSQVYVVSGDSGQGMTTGAMAGMLIRDLVLNRENPWAKLYDPARVTPSSLRELVAEKVTDVMALAEHLTPGELSSIDELQPGQGAIIRSGLKKLAAYRAESGRLYVHSAACTHSGCVLHWNPYEICWDCPCHGSHFAPDGHVLNGPAVRSLAEP